MKRGLVAVTMVVLLGLVALASPSMGDYLNAVSQGADRLLLLQNSSNYGWEWAIPPGSLGSTGGTSYHNLYGVTSVGLIGAGLVTGDNIYYEAANNAVNYMVSGNPNPGDLYNNAWGYADNYVSMVGLSTVGAGDYSGYAATQWAWTITNIGKYQPGNLDQLYQGAFNHVSGWDAAYGAGTQAGYALWNTARYGIAAIGIGDSAWANELGDVIAAHIAEPNPATGWCYGLGWGQSLAFLSLLDPVKYAPQIATLVASLVGSQGADGSWEVDDIQATAYAMLGLAVSGVSDAAGKAAEWILSQQNTNGGWAAWGSEYPEIDSEAIQGLIAYQLGLYTADASRYGVIIDDAIDLLIKKGLLDASILLPYLGAGATSVRIAAVAAAVSAQCGLSPKQAVSMVKKYGIVKVGRALRLSHGNCGKFQTQLLGYGVGGGAGGGLLDKQIVGGGGSINGVTIQASYTQGDIIHVAFTLTDPVSGDVVTDAVATLSVIRVDPVECTSWSMIPYSEEEGEYRIDYDTAGLAPGYYDLYIGTNDGQTKQLRVEITAS